MKALFFLVSTIFFISTKLNAAGLSAPPPPPSYSLPNECPFATNDRSSEETISGLRAELNTLAAQAGDCPQVQAQVGSIEDVFNTIISSQLPTIPVSSTGEVQVTCENYNQALRLERDTVLEYIGSEAYIPRGSYGSCVGNIGGLQSQRECVNTIYGRRLAEREAHCEFAETIQLEAETNNQVASSLNQLATLASGLIENSNSCESEEIQQNIGQIMLSLATSIGSSAVGGGIPGAAVAYGGAILSELIQSFSEDRSAGDWLDELQEHEDWERVNCLYHQVQKNALSCGVPEAGNTINAETAFGCWSSDTSLADQSNAIANLMGAIELIEDQSMNQISSDRLTSLYDQFRTSLGQRIPDPKNPDQEISTRTLLERAKDRLLNAPDDSPTRTSDRNKGRRIEGILTALDQAEQALNSGTGNSADQRLAMERTLKALKYDLGSEVPNPFNLMNSLRAAWRIEYGENTGSQSAVKDLLVYDHAMTMLTQGSIDHIQGLADTTDERQRILAHSIMVDEFQDKFEDRLEKLNSEFNENRKSESDDDFVNHNLPMLEVLLKECALNAGMHHFEKPDGDRFSVNMVDPEPSDIYNEACQRFQCQGLLPKFPPQSDRNSLGTVFRRYQCGINADFPRMLDQLRSNYRNHRAICAPPSDLVIDSSESGSTKRPWYGRDLATGELFSVPNSQIELSDSMPAPSINTQGSSSFGFLDGLIEMIGDFFSFEWLGFGGSTVGELNETDSVSAGSAGRS